MGHAKGAVLLGAALLGLCCAGPPRVPRTLVVAVASGPASLAPNTTLDEAALSILGNVYETLVDLDARLGLAPGLAESWHNPDPLTWTFRLRDGVRRHDGVPLTARDVVASLEHARLDPASVRRGLLADVASVDAADERTVRVRTRRVMDALPSRLSRVLVWARSAGTGGPAVGTGPYRVAEWAPGGDVRLERVDPGAEATVVQRAEFRAVADAARRLRLLEAGAVQLVPDAPGAPAANLEADLRLAVSVQEHARLVFLSFDCARAPFRDRRVRQALALAIDRQALLANVAAGGALAEQLPAPDQLGAYAASLPARPFDAAGARRLLAEAGQAGGFGVELDYAPSGDLAEAALALAADLRRVGIRAEPRPISEAQLLQRVERQDCALCLRGFTSETGDGRLDYEVLLHTRADGFGLLNAGSYSSPELDALVREASGPISQEQRRLLLARLASKVQLDVPIVPLYSGRGVSAFDRALVYEPRLDRRIRLDRLRWRD